MFYDPLTGAGVLDFVGGREDLAGKIVRSIGDPHARFTEDKLRMLRAVRITARVSTSSLDEEDRPGHSSPGQRVQFWSAAMSLNRPRSSRRKCSCTRAGFGYARWPTKCQLMEMIVPELAPVIATAGRPAAHDRWRTTLCMLELLDSPRFELALAALLHDLASAAAAAGRSSDAAELRCCRRLKLSNDECHDVAWLVGQRDALHNAVNWKMSRLKRLLAQPLIGDLLALARAHAVATETSLADVEFCEHYLRSTPIDQINPQPLITGDDLKRAGIVPGPRFKELLELVRDAQLDVSRDRHSATPWR